MQETARHDPFIIFICEDFLYLEDKPVVEAFVIKSVEGNDEVRNDDKECY
jgi:hypothetical protein